jgi:hypothetical protein
MEPEQQPSSLPKQLLTFAILACIASFGYTYYQSHQVTTRNLSRSAAVLAYQDALEKITHTANNNYPKTGAGFFCINQNPNGMCWNMGHSTAPPLEAALTPVMNARPNPDPQDLPYDGIIYQNEDNGGGYTLLWFLEGVKANCDPGFVVNPNFGNSGSTLCEVRQ